jgi:polyphosphate kinase
MARVPQMLEAHTEDQEAGGPRTFAPADRFINRELSWLEFNDRVLGLAHDPQAPLLERVKFLAIFASNLDEFYMVRVAGLKRQVAAEISSRSADGMTPKDQLELIGSRVLPMIEQHAHTWLDEIMPGLEQAGIFVQRWKELEDRQRKELDAFFSERIFPVVTPLAVDPGHPFPYISNLSLNLAVLVRDPTSDDTHFARVKVPPLLPRFVPLTDEEVFVPIEDVIAANLDELFPGMEIVEHHAFRVTRNADLELNDDGAEDLLEALEAELRKRRFSPAVRLEVEAGMSDYVLDLLMREIEIEEPDVHSLPGPLDLAGLWVLHSIDRPDLKDDPFKPVTPKPLATGDGSSPNIFSVLARRDVLVHHPYESFTKSVQQFIEQAARDPKVLAIKQTLYRTSGDSPIIDALVEAAEEGKQVVVLVEIKARFDERNNIHWARELERAGCHVVYGLVGLKTHCKLCLVVRQEGRHLRRYCHIGTGNYNPKTARLYEDFGLLTADDNLGADVSDLFNYLTGYSRMTSYSSIVTSPHKTREHIIALIEREMAGSTPDRPGHIMMKMNSLIDEAVVDALYRASQANVRIDLCIRGICALRPKVPGLSDNIVVRSILGRFLEHSRIFYFHNGGGEDFYIGSADMMHRNLDRRVEALVSVVAGPARERLRLVLDLCMADNLAAWDLGSDGTWTKLRPEGGEEPLSVQHELLRRAMTDA